MGNGASCIPVIAAEDGTEGDLLEKLYDHPGLLTRPVRPLAALGGSDTQTWVHLWCERGQVLELQRAFEWLATSPLPVVREALRPYCRRAGLPPPACPLDGVRLAADMANSRGQTPLMLACAAGCPRLVQYLIDQGADLWTEDAVCGRTALLYAASSGSAECVAALMRAGPGRRQGLSYVNCPSMSGATALHYAVFHSGHDALRELLRHHPAINAATTSAAPGIPTKVTADAGATALHVAAARGNVRAAQLLLRYYASRRHPGLEDPRQVRNAAGRQPWQLAAAHAPALRRLTTMLHPALPLARALGDEGAASTDKAKCSGPPSLATLAAAALQRKLLASVDAAAAAAATAATPTTAADIDAAGPSCSSAPATVTVLRLSPSAHPAPPTTTPIISPRRSDSPTSPEVRAASRREAREAPVRSSAPADFRPSAAALRPSPPPRRSPRHSSSSGTGTTAGTAAIPAAGTAGSTGVLGAAGAGAGAGGGTADVASWALPAAMARVNARAARHGQTLLEARPPHLPPANSQSASSGPSLLFPSPRPNAPGPAHVLARAQHPQAAAASSGAEPFPSQGHSLSLRRNAQLAGGGPGPAAPDSLLAAAAAATAAAAAAQARAPAPSPPASANNAPTSQLAAAAAGAADPAAGRMQRRATACSLRSRDGDGDVRRGFGGGSGGDSQQLRLPQLASPMQPTSLVSEASSSASGGASGGPGGAEAVAAGGLTPRGAVRPLSGPATVRLSGYQPSPTGRLPSAGKRALTTNGLLAGGAFSGAVATGGQGDDDDEGMCSVCFARREEVAPAGCRHGLCATCAAQLCRAVASKPLLCPFCRRPVSEFVRVAVVGA
ncbi:hypothetical protein HYH03_005526 [Edaphochlamys debaryana]|uniref:RING-type domain-containing protein n=1 Tax=Edaphochlamys debaryana TaxID=47281 RepID=A0A835Y5D0_9CHLO|nr:hypothetical protein HYH03_005526 [Edaphochlamys debaryana]|eukprot:KAG2496293.1 hypothetical protein HYH03_005526 [Edaphochlamys debaryana]